MQAKKLSDWIEESLSKGKISFSLSQAMQAFPDHSEIAVKRSLNRLSVKGDIISIYKGYYLIISPQYALRGILPPVVYIDYLMKYLNRPYYIALLNAAAFYGAAHQQPQEFFVITNFPVLRPTQKKGIKVNYISIANIPLHLLQEQKTESGYVKISSPELTACDLVQFEKRIGGLNRAATVLNELTDEIKTEKINAEFLKEIPVAIIQRLGYIMDKVLHKKEMAEHLYNQCVSAGINFSRIPLKASGVEKGFSSDEKWKVVVNTEIEIDE